MTLKHLNRRVSPVASEKPTKHVTAPAPVPQHVSRIRRVRTEAAPRHATAIAEKLKSISELMVDIGKLTAEREAAERELEALLKSARLTHFDTPEATAAIVTPSGKSSTNIDASKFYEAVDEKDFWGCVTVSVTKAKAVLSEREIQAISTVTPATPGTPKLVVKLTAK